MWCHHMVFLIKEWSSSIKQGSSDEVAKHNIFLRYADALSNHNNRSQVPVHYC